MIMNVLSLIPKLSEFPAQIFGKCGSVRFASKKTSTGARWQDNKRKPKRRGVKIKDGEQTTAGATIVKQNQLFAFPGLNVGFGKCGNLYAMEAGEVVTSCEKPDANWNHSWLQRTMSHQNPAAPFYKLYYNNQDEEYYPY